MLPGGHISRAGYHLTKLQVGGASALSNAVIMLLRNGTEVKQTGCSTYKWRGIEEHINQRGMSLTSYQEEDSKAC